MNGQLVQKMLADIKAYGKSLNTVEDLVWEWDNAHLVRRDSNGTSVKVLNPNYYRHRDFVAHKVYILVTDYKSDIVKIHCVTAHYAGRYGEQSRFRFKGKTYISPYQH